MASQSLVPRKKPTLFFQEGAHKQDINGSASPSTPINMNFGK